MFRPAQSPKTEFTNAKPAEVAVIYHMFPHYRAPVLRALARRPDYVFRFFGSHEAFNGILPYTGDELVTVAPTKFRSVGPFGVSSGYLSILFARRVRAVVLLGNPNFLDTWVAAILARLARKRVLFWTHGWLRRERLLKQWVRNAYFALSDRVLVYSDRARILAGQSGFDERKVVPIYNSLDWPECERQYTDVSQSTVTALRSSLGLAPDRPVIVCTARLISSCRFDLLIRASAEVARRNRPLQIVLIGDGPERDTLSELARKLDVSLQLTGAIYDEAVLARYLYAADATVSPGKVGLAAMHSLSYGTPVVTHGDLDHQMPEVEALIVGTTGEFFRRNDIMDLAQAIEKVLTRGVDRETTRRLCRQVIMERYTPDAQANKIASVLNELAL